MLSLPVGILALLPFTWFVYTNRSRPLCRACALSREGMLWFIFLLLLGGFITINARVMYFNVGGVVALVFAARLFAYGKAKRRWRIVMVALVSATLCFCYSIGMFWWLAKLPFATNWLLPLLCGLLAAAIGGERGAALGGGIFGMLSGSVMATAFMSQGRLAVEFGALAHLNTMLLTLAVALLAQRLAQMAKRKKEPVQIRWGNTD